MRDLAEVVEFINALERRMLARPTMYAATPESLEDQFMLLENLLEFILDRGNAPSAYASYLVREGYGNCTVSGRLADQGVCNHSTVFDAVVDVLRRYLDSARPENQEMPRQ